MSNPFDDIGYEDFRRMALDPALSPHEKIGFPDSYRKGFEPAIFQDILAKASNLALSGKTVVDIGPGCAGLPRLIIDHCVASGHELTLVDSQEMLDHLPDVAGVRKIAGFYPDCGDALAALRGRADVVICYSVFHYVFVEAGFWRFIDDAIDLLAPGGQLLLGDIPNISKRKRFFSSQTGIRFHQNFMKTTELPVVQRDNVEHGRIDDAALLGVIMRCRAQGCDAYWLPQAPALPMANRREDLLVIKP